MPQAFKDGVTARQMANYLDTYKLTARELAARIILDVLETTGITATAGIGTNLYLR